MDQGLHNVLLQHYSDADWVAIRAKDEPRFKRAPELLSLVANLQRELTVEEAPAEAGYICTLALLANMGITRDAEGYVTKHGDPTVRCTVVHQVDRDVGINDFYSQKYALTP